MSSLKTDVLFVHPNASKKTYQDLSTDMSAIEPPIWAALLANRMRAEKFSPKILDCEAERIGAKESAQRIIAATSRLIVIVVYGQQPSASTQNMQGASDLLNELVLAGNSSKVILVGLHPSSLPRQTLEMEKTDFVCQGEGPETLLGLLSCLDMNDYDSLSKIPGLWFRCLDGTISFTRPAQTIRQENLVTDLPGMAWDLLPMEKYRTSNWHAMTNGNVREPFASLYTSLGCPFKCSFCCINAPFGANSQEGWPGLVRNKLRFWNTDFIMSELDKIHSMGIRNVKIADEMFVLNKDHFLNLCQKIAAKDYNFNIWAYSRIDTIREEYLETLRSAGVKWLALGIESGNHAVRSDVTKGKFTGTNIREIVGKIKTANINVIGNFIFGLPEDDIESMKETLKLAKELQCEFANFYCTMAYPGSLLHLEAVKNNWGLPATYDGYSQHSYEMRPLDTKKISAAQVVQFRDDAFHEYYENETYLKFIQDKFGIGTRKEIEKMTKIRLKRRLLDDQKKLH